MPEYWRRIRLSDLLHLLFVDDGINVAGIDDCAARAVNTSIPAHAGCVVTHKGSTQVLRLAERSTRATAPNSKKIECRGLR